MKGKKQRVQREKEKESEQWKRDEIVCSLLVQPGVNKNKTLANESVCDIFMCVREKEQKQVQVGKYSCNGLCRNMGQQTK